MSYGLGDMYGTVIAAPSGPQSPIAGYIPAAGAVAPSAAASNSPMTAQTPTAATPSAPTIAWVAVLAAYVVLRLWAENTGATLE